MSSTDRQAVVEWEGVLPVAGNGALWLLWLAVHSLLLAPAAAPAAATRTHTLTHPRSPPAASRAWAMRC